MARPEAPRADTPRYAGPWGARPAPPTRPCPRALAWGPALARHARPVPLCTDPPETRLPAGVSSRSSLGSAAFYPARRFPRGLRWRLRSSRPLVRSRSGRGRRMTRFGGVTYNRVDGAESGRQARSSAASSLRRRYRGWSPPRPPARASADRPRLSRGKRKRAEACGSARRPVTSFPEAGPGLVTRRGRPQVTEQEVTAYVLAHPSVTLRPGDVGTPDLMTPSHYVVITEEQRR